MSEVADFLNESQFIGGRSAFECVAYCASLVKYAGQPGKGPTGSVAESSNTAQYWYGRLEGSTDASNTNGMSLDALYTMLQGLGMHYYPIAGDYLEYIEAWLRLGYPVLLCGNEVGMHDLDLGDNVPYSWPPSGSHCIVASGIASDGNLLVRDTASIAPSGVRPGPRRYDALKLQIVSATAVAVPWLPTLPGDYDPVKTNAVKGIPAGWHDTGTELIAPNNVAVVRGFREYVLEHNWNPANVPLEAEHGVPQLEGSNPALGAGTQQAFNWKVLEWTDKRGVFEMWCGKELLFSRSQVSKYYTLAQQLRGVAVQLQSEVEQMQAQLQSATAK